MLLNILIVDDSRTARAVIGKTLQLAEIPINRLHEATNGQEALTLLSEHPIDLIFTDLHMPVMDGLQMIEAMNAEPSLKTIPVVVISSDSSKSRIEQLQAQGVKAFIHKPFAPEKFREIIEKVIGLTNAN